MRAKRVADGVRVHIIAGVDAGRFGTIEGQKEGVVAVRTDGEHFARHYTSNQLKLVETMQRQKVGAAIVTDRAALHNGRVRNA